MTQGPFLCPRSEATYFKTIPCSCQVQGLVIRELGGNVDWILVNLSLLPGKSQDSYFPGRHLASFR